MVTVYTCLKIYLYKKHCFFLPTILHSLACFIIGLLNMDLCIRDCEMSGQLRASESFFSFFRVEIVGPIFLSFLKNISQIFDVVNDFNHIRT